MGYEVGFARVADPSLEKGGISNKRQESFNSRLKAEGDQASTNLYVSNLPKNMTESVSFGHCHIVDNADLPLSRNLVPFSWITRSALAESYATATTTVVVSVLLGNTLFQIEVFD